MVNKYLVPKRTRWERIKERERVEEDRELTWSRAKGRETRKSEMKRKVQEEKT